ncbi:hypothetical protein Y1Q_0019267 [Alligator mississippiensis]|uniref:Uncharacterized protein n=1 Tax=Alligator mississippiensis TaxID=8496 RepID=A0A151MQL1_ALLMI|nr:hypothetical protein Y1Q_0019267 [Alligator mississippiensis]
MKRRNIKNEPQEKMVLSAEMFLNQMNCLKTLRLKLLKTKDRSTACPPNQWTSKEHLQLKRNAYATVILGLKVYSTSVFTVITLL